MYIFFKCRTLGYDDMSRDRYGVEPIRSPALWPMANGVES